MEVSLMEMLLAREARANRQRRLLAQYGKPLISFTMNIAGPVKNNSQIAQGYALGKRLLEQQLMAAGTAPIHFEEIREKTGSEAFYVLDLEPLTLKAITVELEDHTTVGRLLDLDVLRPNGQKVDRQELGLEARTCLLCGRQAQVCARSRAHTVAQLQEKTAVILDAALRDDDAKTAARLACQALLYEVAATPKPGLVDRVSNGSHRDMDFFTFQASTAALWPYFEQCTKIGHDTRDLAPAETFSRLRIPGKLAEGEMLWATGGVNTHKGAIFSLGILCGALGRLDRTQWCQPEIILDQCAQMTAGLVARDYAGLTEETARTAGQRLYLRHGITGVRGQAEAGFPAVLQIGLPRLEAGLARGLSLNDAGCAALLSMLAATVDTNIIARSDYETQQWVQAEAEALLQKNPFPEKEALQAMDSLFTARNLSPGGTADLLALVYLLHFLRENDQNAAERSTTPIGTAPKAN